MEKVDYKILSNLRCKEPGCNKRLKQNLINNNPDAEHCFKHWVLNKIPHMRFKRLHLNKKENPATNGASSHLLANNNS